MLYEVLTYVLSALVTMLCVVVHYEALRYLWRVTVIDRGRRGVLLVVSGLFVVHVLEIWIYAISYLTLSQWPIFGRIEGAEHILDYAYFSASSYTTLGFGDLVPHGPLRALTGTEGLAGLAFITWSASFTFLEMQRLWPGRD